MSSRATPEEWFKPRRVPKPPPQQLQAPAPQRLQYDYYYDVDYRPVVIVVGTIMFFGFLAFLAYMAKE